MRLATILSLPLGLSLCSASPSLQERDSQSTTTASTACATGVHMIVARASTEKPGQGVIGGVSKKVQNIFPGSDSEAVDYPATIDDYVNSEAAGVTAMTSMIEAYVQRCPSSKIVLLGYSQGAQVVGDTVCGRNETFFNPSQPLENSALKNVVAIIQMGDPTFVGGRPQDVGNYTKGGVFPRLDNASCASTVAITQSYCDNDDKFCDSGNSEAVHESYVDVYGDAAAKFIVAKANSSTVSTKKASMAAAFSRPSFLNGFFCIYLAILMVLW